MYVHCTVYNYVQIAGTQHCACAPYVDGIAGTQHCANACAKGVHDADTEGASCAARRSPLSHVMVFSS